MRGCLVLHSIPCLLRGKTSRSLSMVWPTLRPLPEAARTLARPSRSCSTLDRQIGGDPPPFRSASRARRPRSPASPRGPQHTPATRSAPSNWADRAIDCPLDRIELRRCGGRFITARVSAGGEKADIECGVVQGRSERKSVRTPSSGRAETAAERGPTCGVVSVSFVPPLLEHVVRHPQEYAVVQFVHDVLSPFPVKCLVRTTVI